jgi:hypothetical protein
MEKTNIEESELIDLGSVIEETKGHARFDSDMSGGRLNNIPGILLD